MCQCKKHKGFSLIELIIAIAIVAIITSVALPSYLSQVARSNRAEGKSFLLDVASRQERYYTANSEYATDAELMNPTSETGLYTLAVDQMGTNDTRYRLIAEETWGDTYCGNLTLTNTNTRSIAAVPNPTTATPAEIDLINECWR